MKLSVALPCSMLFALSLSVNASEIIGGVVVAVGDGDTVTVLMKNNQQVIVKLAQIDAPEDEQSFGAESKQSMTEIALNKNAILTKEGIDNYGRIISTIFMVDGIDVNHEQVMRGMAWVYHPNLYDQSLLQTETEARNAKIGLWSAPESDPTPPGVFRQAQCRESGNNESTCVPLLGK